MDIYRIALVWLEEGRNFALGTVVHAQGSTPQKAGSKAILDDQGNQEGTLGGGLVEAEGLERMKQAISDKTAKLYEVRLDEAYSRSAGPICGGVMRLFVNPQGRANAEVYRSAVEAVEEVGDAGEVGSVGEFGESEEAAIASPPASGSPATRRRPRRGRRPPGTARPPGSGGAPPARRPPRSPRRSSPPSPPAW